MKKPDILRNQRDFNRLYNKGKSSGSKYAVLLVCRNGLEFNRKAFVASKKVGNSVKRHRAVRLMKEAYREIENTFPTGYDILLIARNNICEAKCADVKKSIEAAKKRAFGEFK
jgi:ribonuclease P protein component